MKILFTLLFSALATIANAQLLFVCGNDTIASGSTYATDKCDPDWLEDGIYKFTPDLCVVSSEDVNITVTASSATLFQFCFGGSCAVGKSFTKSGNLKAGNPTNFMIDAGNDTGTASYTVNVAAWVTGKESTKISMTLVMTNDQKVLGVDHVSASGANIAFANGALHYSLPSAAPRTLTLTSLSGAAVATWHLSSAHGSLSLLGIKPGVYAYAVSGTDKRGKVVVR